MGFVLKGVHIQKKYERVAEKQQFKCCNEVMT
jgi:hypothetical protein